MDGTTDHLVGYIKHILSVHTNESPVSNENQISSCDMKLDWKVSIIDVDNHHKTQHSILDLDEESSRLRFTAKQNSHIMHFDLKERRREMVLQKLNMKSRTKKMETCIAATNQNMSITFHFTE